MDNKCYIVLGMHRGGTSLTAGIVHHAGVELLHGAPLSRNKESPIGYFENRELMLLNDSILRLAGGTWKLPPEEDKILDAGHKVKERVVNICNKFDTHDKWGIKDPRLCLTFPVYEPYLKNIHIIVVTRDYESNFNGFKRVRFPHLHQKYRNEEYFKSLYLRHLEGALAAAEKYPSLIVSFEKYFKGTREIKKIHKFVGSDVDIKVLTDLINPKFKHH